MTESRSKSPPRPSEFYVYANCEASYALMRASGEEPATTYSYKGTKVHRVLAASGSLNELSPDENKTFEWLWKGFRDQVRQWRGGAQVDNVWNEHEFSFHYQGQPLFVGHPDKVIKSGARLFIPDFKTGWHTLDAISATNLQLRGYVALADANIPGIEEVTVWIDKPGKTDPPAVYDRQAIDAAKAWAIELVSRVAFNQPGGAKPTKGAWCQYCSGKVLCPLWREDIQTLAASQDLVDDLPDQQLALIAPKLDIAKKVIERLKARLEARVKANPDLFPGWRFKPGRLDPEITSVLKAYVALKDDLEAGVFLNATNLAIGELVKIYRDATKTTWEAAREQVEKKLGENLKYSRTKPSLVYDPAPVHINDVTDGN